jgi:MoxR-like ATPase
MMLTNRLFEYVEAGSSVRGLLDWPRAAIAEAFFEGSAELRRRHFRAVADDVLRHRIRLTPEARAEDIAPDHLIHLLVDTLLPLRDGDTERAEDRTPLIL